MTRRDPILLLLSLPLVVCLAACGKSDSAETEPGTAQVVKAIVKGLFSNSVEVEERGSAPDRAYTPPSFADVSDSGAGETCEIPYSGPVKIISVRTPGALARAVSAEPSWDLVYETDDTAIFRDGRVMTTDLESVGSHLNAVGWSSNPMQIMGGSVRPGASTANLGWASAPNSTGGPKKKKKKRRG